MSPIDLSLPPDFDLADPEAREFLAAYWEKEIGFTCEAERTLIRQMAAARVRLDRCQAAEDAHLKLARQKADAEQLADRRKKARKIAQSLPKHPSTTLDRLESTREGRDWLTNRWRDLDTALAQGIKLTEPQQEQAMNLMGYHAAAPGPDAPMFVRQLWANLLNARLTDLRYDKARSESLGGFVPPPEAPPDAQAARKWLRDLCGTERIRLDRLNREKADLEPDPREAEQARNETNARHADALIAATDPEAQARRKIEREADASYRSNLALLIRLRNGQQRLREWELKEARRRPPRDEPPPKPNPKLEAHHDATPIPASASVANPAGAPERTTSAPGATAVALDGRVPTPHDPHPSTSPAPDSPTSDRERTPAHQPGHSTSNTHLQRPYITTTPGAP